jgi:TRAP-type C4-dicarboxylate transport system permease small subunit
VLDAFYATLMAGSVLALVAAFVCVVLGIADRQFALGLRGLDAYAGYAIAAALFLALPGTLKRGEHIRVTLVMQRLQGRWRTALEAWCLAAALLLAAMLAWYTLRLVWASHSTGDVSQGSDATPLWLPQLAMAAGCIGLLVAFADATWSRLRGHHFFDSTPGDAARSE